MAYQDEPLFRADLFDSMDGPPGNLRSAHFHPTFDGVEPSDRNWDDAIQRDPLAWLVTELSDLPGLLKRAGVDDIDASDVDDDAAALRDVLPAVVQVVQATWEAVRAG